jgi:glycosyltransferase A (GT-A) superfamily protein (DUF2064 family)
LAPDFGLVRQQGAALGDRLAFVLSYCLVQGYKQVVAMNSDGPTLPATYVSQAFAALDEATTDLVLGPCEDGGYYLIGWKRPLPQLVRDVPMSTPTVLRDTLALAAAAGLKAVLLPSWYDVDEQADLERLRAELPKLPVECAAHSRRFLDALHHAQP